MTAELLCSILEIDREEKDCNSDHIERMLVKKLQFLLLKNTYYPKAKKIWQKLSHENSNFQSIHSLREILEIGNASVIAYATIKNPPKNNKTCVWLSADEHPVYNHYKRIMSSLFGDV